jgi:hypothetical protein
MAFVRVWQLPMAEECFLEEDLKADLFYRYKIIIFHFKINL